MIDTVGTRLHVSDINECFNLPPSLELLWSHAEEARKHCLLLERTLEQLPGENFPIIVGRRPSNTSSSVGKENQVPNITVSILLFY